MKTIDISGERFGKLLVESLSKKRTNKGEVFWNCVCDCGGISEVRGNYLRNGTTKSCGCLKKPHGMTMTPTWQSWNGMIARCKNKKNKRYPSYGGRGISVCRRWENFNNFLSDMGVRPEGKTIDRINNDGNYEPSNCRWADRYEQQANTRKARKCMINGAEFKTIGEAARLLGIHRATIQYRITAKTVGYELV